MIEKAFGLRGNERHKDDATSVGLWVEEMRQSDHNPVLWYKAHGEKDIAHCAKMILFNHCRPPFWKC